MINYKCRLLLISGSLSLLLNSCTHFHDRPLNSEESASRLEARTLANKALHDFIDRVTKKPPPPWTLNTLSLAALYYHPDMALAQASAETVDAAITTAAQRPNPSLTLSPTWISNLATAAAPWIIATSLSIPLETASKRDIRIAKSQYSSAAAWWRVADTAWLVRARCRSALLEVYAAQEATRLVQQQIILEQRVSQALAQQLASGEIARPDLLRSQLAVNQLQLALNTAEKRTADSRVLLAAAIGVPVKALTGIDIDFGYFAKPFTPNALSVQHLRTLALRQRPDVLAALADYDAAQSALQLEIANQYPNIQLNPSYTWEMGENRWSLAGTTQQLPIFHQNQGLIGEAEAKRHETGVRFEALQLRILNDIDRALAGVTAVTEKLNAVAAQQRHQEELLHSAQTLLQAGEIDHHAVLTIQLEQLVIERTRLDVLIESQQTRHLLEDALRLNLGVF